jgi:hypothetical protein
LNVPIIPLLIENIARVDPRSGVQEAYNAALAFGFQQLRAAQHNVLDKLPSKDFLQLDRMKQRGFYTSVEQSKFVPPRNAVDPMLSKAVCDLAWRAASTLDFVMGDGNVDRYFAMAESIRSKSTEEAHQGFERFGQQVTNVLFDLDEDDSEEPEKGPKQ